MQTEVLQYSKNLAKKALQTFAVTQFSVPESHYSIGLAENTPLSHCALAWEHQWVREQSS